MVPYQLRRAIEKVVSTMTGWILTFKGLNIGSATGATSGDINASGGLNLGTAANAAAGEIKASGGLNVGTASGAGDGGVAYSENLHPFRGGGGYTAYAFVPLTTPLTSTSWDGDSFSTTASTLIDLSEVFSVPAGVKAVLVRLAARDSAAWGTASLYVALNGANNVAKSSLFARPAGGDIWIENSGIVLCNVDGDIYYDVAASGASTLDVVLEIYGYFI